MEKKTEIRRQWVSRKKTSLDDFLAKARGSVLLGPHLAATSLSAKGREVPGSPASPTVAQLITDATGVIFQIAKT